MRTQIVVLDDLYADIQSIGSIQYDSIALAAAVVVDENIDSESRNTILELEASLSQYSIPLIAMWGTEQEVVASLAHHFKPTAVYKISALQGGQLSTQQELWPSTVIDAQTVIDKLSRC